MYDDNGVKRWNLADRIIPEISSALESVEYYLEQTGNKEIDLAIDLLKMELSLAKFIAKNIYEELDK